jgi:hypothetical protein
MKGCNMAEDNGVVDIRSLTCPSLDLVACRERLEQAIAPYATTKRTRIIISFKGKRRYLKKLSPDVTLHSVYALQKLYDVESAKKAGDIDKAIRAALIANDLIFRVATLHLFGVADPMEAAATLTFRKNQSSKALKHARETRIKGTCGPRIQSHAWMEKLLPNKSFNEAARQVQQLFREQSPSDRPPSIRTIQTWYREHPEWLAEQQRCAGQ